VQSWGLLPRRYGGVGSHFTGLAFRETCSR
jgi:hypothetical protein